MNMGTSKDPASGVAARFLADLRANTTRTTDQRDDPAWHAMALVAFELFGESAETVQNLGGEQSWQVAAPLIFPLSFRVARSASQITARQTPQVLDGLFTLNWTYQERRPTRSPRGRSFRRHGRRSFRGEAVGLTVEKAERKFEERASSRP
jgi:hypothetical protein